MSASAAIPSWTFTFTPGLPVLALDLAFHGPRRVLAHGPLDPQLGNALRVAGVDVTLAPSAVGALRTLAWTHYDAVLVDPEAADGIALVTALKLGAPFQDASDDDVRLAARRHRVTPVFVLPLPDGDEYAVIVIAPGVAFLERTTRVPLLRAIVKYNYGQLPEVKSPARFDPGVS